MKKETNNKVPKGAKPHLARNIFLVVLGLVILISAGFGGYRYYENHKEIGIDHTTKATNGQTASGRTDWIKPYSTLASGHGNAYLFLTQLDSTKNGRREFSGSSALMSNLILLLSSGQPKDINQAAALYQRNQRNYHFTSPKNRLAASLGQTASYYNNYFTKIKGISDYAAEAYQTALGKLVKQEVNDPISLALIGTQILQPGQLELITDPDSSFANLGLSGVEYKGTIQYHTDEDLKHIPAVNIADTNKMFHPEKSAIKAYGDNFHALYISHVKGNSNGSDIYVYLIEDKSGKLHYWGNYYRHAPSNMVTLAEYQKLTKNVKPDKVTGKDINWSTFVDSLK